MPYYGRVHSSAIDNGAYVTDAFVKTTNYVTYLVCSYYEVVGLSFSRLTIPRGARVRHPDLFHGPRTASSKNIRLLKVPVQLLKVGVLLLCSAKALSCSLATLLNVR